MFGVALFCFALLCVGLFSVSICVDACVVLCFYLCLFAFGLFCVLVGLVICVVDFDCWLLCFIYLVCVWLVWLFAL